MINTDTIRKGRTSLGAAECVEKALSVTGKNVVLGLPIGLGKPIHLANEFYRRAKAGEINLTVSSGLMMEAPGWNSDLERRFIEPLVKRLFPDWPAMDFYIDARKGSLPDNVAVNDFYFTPGTGLGNVRLQSGYISSNYTHVARDVSLEGCNVTAFMVTPGACGGRHMYSLGCNADAAVDMVWATQANIRAGKKAAMIAQVNPSLPFMYGAGVLEPDIFTAVADDPAQYYGLFAPPHEPITAGEYFIGMFVSSLIRDGGTYQVGFGSLGDAVTYALQMRHGRNGLYRDVLSGVKAFDKFGGEIKSLGGAAPFDRGLYACSEFLSDGIMALIKDGIIKRKVYNNVHIQRLLNEGQISERVSAEMLRALLEADAVHERLTAKDFAMLSEYGIFKEGLSLENGMIRNGNSFSVRADLSNGESFDEIVKHCLGDSLKNGLLAHAGFLLGSQDFYESLRRMPEEEKRRIQMREISFVNQLYGGEELRRLQRLSGRFVNSAMMVTPMGAVVSDTLDDGQVVSGVGGQYNFVSMGHALEDGRSVIILRSTRMKDGAALSNIVWSQGNATIPRHLRDIVVTEYGIADLRGQTDGHSIIAVLNITDSHFQEGLLKKAKEKKKLPADARIDPLFRNNYPEAIEGTLRPFKKEGCFPVFPYGCEYTKEELVLGKALRGLKSKMSFDTFEFPSLSGLGKIARPPASARPYLQRLDLDKPANTKEKVMQKLVLYALATDGSI